MAGRFDGKVIVVTGGGGGIGRATAVRFASEGARVALVDVDDAALKASVAAVEGLTRTAALELAPRGIRVNAVCPAPIETNMVKALEAGAGAGARERLTGTLPLRRFGDPAEVAALVAFLCSGDSAYITGGIYTVDGGATA